MDALTTKQRRYLRGLAHHLNPVVVIGKEGVDAWLVDEIGGALQTHELIKIKVLDTAPLERKSAADTIAAALSAHSVGMIGRIAMVYLPREKDPEIRLPRAAKAAAKQPQS